MRKTIPMTMFTTPVLAQFEAALAMVRSAIDECPNEHWDSKVASWPFWLVAYHALCFADFYCARSTRVWKPEKGEGNLHPKGRKELEDEYPSRRFERAELQRYADRCQAIVREALARETPKSLAGPSGFSWLKMTRAEVYLYNLRHIQHHAGQMGAFLRRVDPATKAGKWVKRGDGGG